MTLINAPRAASILFDLVASQSHPTGPVLLPANVCPIVPLTMLKARREIRFVDICEKTLAMDTDAALQLARESAPGCALVYVHTFGATAPVDAFYAQLRRQGSKLLIVDDRCAARPDVCPEDRLQGADAVLYSTGYGKYVDLGWGGYAVIDDSLSLQRHRKPYSDSELNQLTHSYQKLIKRPSQTGLQALLRRSTETRWLDLSLPATRPAAHLQQVAGELAKADDHKQNINRIYVEMLPAHMQRPPQFHDWRFQVTVTNKQACLSKLFEKGLFASDHYYPASRLLGAPQCPVAEAQHRNSLNLFNDFNITRKQAEQVASVVCNYAP